jgi:hypothetical protein
VRVTSRATMIAAKSFGHCTSMIRDERDLRWNVLIS